MSDFQEPAFKGSFWKNPNKETDKHPDFKGSVVATEDIPAGTKLWLVGWGPNKGDNGQTYYSLRGTPAAAAKPKARPKVEVDDDEIPF